MILQQQYSSEEITSLLAEAKYHLGRVLYLGELDFDRAVSELDESIRLDGSNVNAYYHLGEAIQVQVERNTMQRAADAWRHYLRNGAPLGHERRVREFLGARKLSGERGEQGGAH